MALTLDAVGTLAATAGTGPAAPAYPSGMATSQLAIAVVGARERTTDITCATSGWTQIGSEAYLTDDVRLSFWEHPYAASDPVPSFSVVSGSGGADANGVFGFIARLSGHDTSNRIDVTAAVATGTEAGMSAPSVNTTTADALVLAGFISSNDVTHTGPGNSATLVTNQLSTVGSQCAMSLVHKTIATPGATGAFPLTQSTSSRYGWAGITLAVRPLVTATDANPGFFLSSQ